jgi:hypothetical protein
MVQGRKWVGFSAVMVAGCAATQQAAVTRQTSADPAALAARPICFAPPHPNLSLIARKNAEDVVHMCEAAARLEHVTVVPVGTPGCAVALVSWSARNTGEFEANCSGWSGYGWGCSGTDVRNKLAKLTVVESNGAPIVETVAALRSTNAVFTEKTFLTLCRVAFHQYPQPFKNYQFEVEVTDVER